MNPNTEVHEIGYLVLGGVGAFVTLIVFILRLGDLAALYYEFEQGKTAHRQRLVAWERLLSCLLFVAIELYMVSVGVFTVSAPTQPYTMLRVFNIGVFYVIAGFTLGLGVLQLWLRRGREGRKMMKENGGGG